MSLKRPEESSSDSDSDHETKRRKIPFAQKDAGHHSEEEIEDKGRNPIGGGAANKKLSTMEWFYKGQTNGEEDIVPCPYVSNDLVELKTTQPVTMTGPDGGLLVRSVHEKDNDDEPDDKIIGCWTSAVTGIQVWVKQFDWRIIGTDFTMALYGKRRTGKTHILKALCFQMRRYFPLVIVFTKTKFNGDLLKMFPDACMFNDLDEGLLERLIEAQKERVKEAKKGPQPWPNCRMLLVLDDVLSDRKNPRYNEMLRKLFFEGRHFWISMIITSQDSKGLPPALKQNTDITFVLPMQARRDRETLADNVFPFLWNDKDAREFLDKIMRIKHLFLAIVNCRGARPLIEQLYAGIITPEDRIPRYVMGSFPCWKDNLDQLAELEFDYLCADPRLETWGLESHMPPVPRPKHRIDGMNMRPDCDAPPAKRRKVEEIPPEEQKGHKSFY